MVHSSRPGESTNQSASSKNRRSFVDVLLWGVVLSCTTFLLWPWIDRGRTYLVAHWSQRKMRAEFQAANQGSVNAGVTSRESRWPYTRIVIPKLGLDAVVMRGIDDQSLMYGPGHDPMTASPGRGNCVIAGHRNTAGWWFNRLDTLKTGEKISLVTMGKTYDYVVRHVKTVSVKDTHLLHPTKEARLTLYTCTVPKTPQRIVVTAALEEHPRQVRGRS